MTSLRRWLPYGLVLVVVIGALVIGSQRSTPPNLDERVRSVATTIKCPECTDKSMAASDAATSVAGRTEIRRQLKAGRTPSEIRSWFVARYGSSILLTPGRTGIEGLIWVLPVMVLVIGAAGLAALFVRWRRIGEVEVSEEDLDLVIRARTKELEAE